MAKSLLSQEILLTVLDRSSEENVGFKDLAIRMWSKYHPRESSLSKDYEKFYKYFMICFDRGKKLTLLGPIMLILLRTQEYERRKLTTTELYAVREYAGILLSTIVAMRARLFDIFWAIIDCKDVPRATVQQIAPDELIKSITLQKPKCGLPRKRPAREEHEPRRAVPPQPTASDELNNFHDSADHIGFAEPLFEEEISNLHRWTDHKMGNLHNWTDHTGFAGTGMSFSFGDDC